MRREALCGIFRGETVQFRPMSARDSLALPRIAAEILSGWLEELAQPEELYPAAHNAAILYLTLLEDGKPAFTHCAQVAEQLSFTEIARLAALYLRLYREEAEDD